MLQPMQPLPALCEALLFLYRLAAASSLTLAVEFLGGDELRLRARQVLVCTSLLSHRPVPLPDDVRSALQPYLNPETAP